MRPLLLITWIAVSSFCFGGNETESLRNILLESITPGELHEDRLDRELKSWPGIKSMDGVEALYDLFERSKDGKEITACYFIQERLEVPAEQVASFLLTRAQENMEDVPLLEKDIRFLGTHTDDPRVSKFLATLLNDKRRSYEKRGEDLIGSIPRVCDSAHGELLGWLQKKGLIKRGDPGWAWDPVFEPDRDQQIREIKPLLVKAGAMEAASTQQRSKPGGASNQLDRSSNVPKVKQSPARQPKSATSATADEMSSRSWLVCLFVGITAFACALWLFLRKSPK